MQTQNTLNVRSSVKGAGRARGFVHEFCQIHSICAPVEQSLHTVLDELLPCLVKITTSPRMKLTITRQDAAVEFEIAHTGPAYDLSDSQHLQWPDGHQDSRISDVSLQIVHRRLDGISCRHENGENHTLLTIRQKTSEAEA